MEITELYDNTTILNRIGELAKEIDLIADELDKPLLAVVILKGALFFATDLMLALKKGVDIEFITVSTYKDMVGADEINFNTPTFDVAGRTVLILEDIIDTGRTISFVTDYFNKAGAKKVITCTLLDKPSRRINDYAPDYYGFEIENNFVVGYGMDFRQQYRNLPYIGILTL